MKGLETGQQNIAQTVGAATVTGGTTSVGIAEMMGWLHSEIGFIAAIIGIFASIMIIISQAVNIRKMRVETKIAIRKIGEVEDEKM